MKNTYTLIALTIIAALTAPTIASAESFWQKHFPEFFSTDTYKGPDPSKTLIAPFADTSVKAGESTKKSWESAESAIALDKSHRSQQDISNWLIATISDTMSFPTNDYLRETQKKAPYFSETGWKQYTAFLESSNIKNAITSNQYALNTIVNEAPALLNKGALNGSYKWLYEINGIITYKDPTMQSYATSEPVSQKLKIKLQVGRHTTAQNPHGILIEQWTGNIHAMDTQK